MSISSDLTSTIQGYIETLSLPAAKEKGGTSKKNNTIQLALDFFEKNIENLKGNRNVETCLELIYKKQHDGKTEEKINNILERCGLYESLKLVLFDGKMIHLSPLDKKKLMDNIPYFKKLFTIDFKEKNLNEIHLPSLTQNEISGILRFIHLKGQRLPSAMHKNILAFLEKAEMLDFSSLKEKIINELSDEVANFKTGNKEDLDKAIALLKCIENKAPSAELDALCTRVEGYIQVYLKSLPSLDAIFKFLQESDILFNITFFNPSGFHISDEECAQLIEFLPNLKTIQICNSDKNYKTNDVILKAIGTKKNLETLVISYVGGFYNPIQNNDLKHFERLTSLKTLSISHCEDLSDAGLEHLKTLANLQALTITGSRHLTGSGLVHLKALTHLKKLDLSECKELKDCNFVHLKTFTNLEELKLSYCSELTGALFEHLKSLTRLRALYLEDCNQLADDKFAYLKGLPGLQKLSLSGCKLLTGSCLTHLNLTNLQELNMSYCSQLDAANLSTLKEAKNLRTLLLSHCQSFTDTGLAFLPELENLRELNLSDCGITSKGLFKHVDKLKTVETLNLNGCKHLEGDVFESFKRLKDLKTLQVERCSLDQKAIEYLKAIKSLKNLFLYKSVDYQHEDRVRKSFERRGVNVNF